MTETKQKESGIALLLVLLAMSIVLVMVMQIVSLSITDIGISSTEEEASRAFSAAEAGIEQVLLESTVGSSVTSTLDNDAAFNAKIEAAGEGRMFNYPKSLGSGESATFWFVSHNPDTDNLECPCYAGNSFDLYWGSRSGQNPAVEVSVYYDSNSNNASNFLSGNFATVRVQRNVYDPQSGRRSNNNFSQALTGNFNKTDGLGLERTYYNRTPAFNPVNVPANAIMVRVRPLYLSSADTTYIGIEGRGNNLPSQVKLATSVGQAGGEGDEAVRTVQAYQTYPEPLSIFDAAIVSPESIVKN